MRFDGDLIEELRRRQLAIGESDAKFARRLGINPETWRMVRHGRTPLTLRTLRGIAQAYPDLGERAQAFFLRPDMR